MAKKREMVQSLILERRARLVRKLLKINDHSGVVPFSAPWTLDSKVSVDRGQALPLRDPVAQLGNLIGAFDLEGDKSNGRNLIRQPGRCATRYARLLLSYF